MPLNTHSIQESLLAIWRAPVKRYSVIAGTAALIALYINLTGQEPVGHPIAPPPIIQGEQLRFPAGHPQLALLSTAPAVAANSVAIELPARLVWNEERTERIYPAFAGRVVKLNADVGQSVHAGQVLATLASPEFGAAQADTAKAQADARFFERALQRQTDLFEAGIVSRKEFEQAQADAQACESLAQQSDVTAVNKVDAGRAAAAGAAGVGTAGVVGSLLTGHKPDLKNIAAGAAAIGAGGAAATAAGQSVGGSSLYRQFVQQCLAERGYNVIGWH